MKPIPTTIKILMAGIMGWAALFSGAAQAYVLSGPHILELMISKYGQAKRMLISQKRIEYTPDDPSVGIEQKETVRYVFPEIFRSDIQSPVGRRIHIVTRNEMLTAIDEKIVHEPEDDFDHYKDILLVHSREAMQERLNWLGVDVLRTSLGRFQDKIAFVIGAQYPDETLSQLWVEKETFRPLRWLMVKTPTTGGPGVLEIQYQDWRLFADNWYPGLITFRENGRLVREIKVQSVQVNPNFPGSLFDISQMKKRFQPAEAAPAKPPGTEGMGGIQKPPSY